MPVRDHTRLNSAESDHPLVSIIIPIGPGDESWRALVQDLQVLPFSAEILCIGTNGSAEPTVDGENPALDPCVYCTRSEVRCFERSEGIAELSLLEGALETPIREDMTPGNYPADPLQQEVGGRWIPSLLPPADAELKLAQGRREPRPPVSDTDESKKRPVYYEWIVAPRGRALQMNCGAARARGTFLWFLHSDSRLKPNALDALCHSLVTNPTDLHYFDLDFLKDGPRWMRANSWGCWIRSHWLGMPFGDQGLCLPRNTFQRLGGYREDVQYGEDHLLVWLARRRGIRLRCTGQTIRTSARKYQQRGWFKTTVQHVVLTIRQAWPQFWLWVLRR